MMGVLLSLLFFASAPLVYAQSSGLSASTNKQSYEPGDRVAITGIVQHVTDDNPVTVIVRNPIGNVYEVGQVPLSNNGFSQVFVLGDGARGGIYTVNIRQDDKTTQIQFQVTAGQIQIIPIFDNEIRVSGKNTNLVKYGNVEISKADNSIAIGVNASKIQNGTIIEEYHVPKRVIDTSNGHLAVKENGISIDCKQTNADVEWVVDCPVDAGVHEITIIGTYVIPEFGTTTMGILALGIVMILAFLSQNRLFVKHG